MPAKGTKAKPKTKAPPKTLGRPPGGPAKAVRASVEKPIPPITPDAVALCDPCQIKNVKTKIICGWQGECLGAHLNSHRRTSGELILTIGKYRARFPNFSTGRPAYSPTEKDIAHMLENNPNMKQATLRRIETIVAPELEQVNKEIALNLRFEELWSMCERDPAAKVFCLASAQDENLLADARVRAERAIKSKKYGELKYINQEIKEVSERYEKSFRSLSLTVEQRRKTNQLGNDAPAQIISNYGNTLRKWSLEKQDAFTRRLEAINAGIAERVRLAILDEVDDSFDAKGDDSEIDYKKAISRISKRAE